MEVNRKIRFAYSMARQLWRQQMPATIVIGAQWGDEGKGSTVDRLAATADIVARFGGGDNAGHTINIGQDVFKLHLVPSGILREQVKCILGNGMVVNPLKLLEELDMLAKLGVDISPERIFISTRAHIITPAHRALDAAREQSLGDRAIGTTLRGIGPAYNDKTARRGIRAGQMSDVESFAEALAHAITEANHTLIRHQITPLDPEKDAQAYVDAAERLRPYLRDTTLYINEQLKAGAQVVCEGAQGALLDVDHGSYPYVTSSSTTTGGALSGLGFGPKYVAHVVGVAKCFSTRVGGGPMPTELDGVLADRLRGTGENFWDEFGTTTGRTRRCGWLDAVMLRYSSQINGFTDVVLTKMDILSGLDEVKIAVAYEVDGERYEFPPATIEQVERAVPIYETLPGWQDDISKVRRAEDLPAAARAYIQRVTDLCDAPVNRISVGPERDQLIHL